jgi:hypothetical protein
VGGIGIARRRGARTGPAGYGLFRRPPAR